MTATPIPRTLALTIYGDLAVSEIAKPPANRKPIITARVGAERSSEAYTRLRVHLDAGRQAYVVCPLIEQSETRLARAAEAEAERLRRAELTRLPRRPAARQAEDGRAARGDAPVQGPRARRARRDDGDRGRRRRSERDDHDRAGGRPLRPRAAAPAARPRRARRRAELLPADLAAGRGAHRDRGAAAAGARRHDRRLRARRGRPRPAPRGPAARHAPVRLERPAFTKLRARPRPDRAAREIAGELRDEDGPWQDEADRMSGDADHRGHA